MFLEVTDINKTYYAGKVPFQALHDITLDITKGEFTALAGPSGSGKTTLLNIIGCIDKPDNGEVFIDGELLTEKNSDELAFYRREHFGFIFQTYNLIPILTAFENVELPLRILKQYSKSQSKDMVMQILKKVGLEGLENRKPLELSGGQQQRVSIARALVKNPKLILADEPTANLDLETGETIVDLMKGMNDEDNVTFIFSTHDELILKHAKRVIRLRDGRVIN
ncbi:ABC transporter ATP-binding protein [Candidatus Dependentiae bacterium]|nr:ABC transporter ATP-binding protein [Candidatus Dependentiae bacterium]